ncbi:hypothetical protein BR93DRAFT_428093 [Coniochaeta sp. PMI_546]|nr:hypothetical protein BR93DRAFT_428093 [Coniochaeta sp. PMI_546]
MAQRNIAEMPRHLDGKQGRKDLLAEGPDSRVERPDRRRSFRAPAQRTLDDRQSPRGETRPWRRRDTQYELEQELHRELIRRVKEEERRLQAEAVARMRLRTEQLLRDTDQLLEARAEARHTRERKERSVQYEQETLEWELRLERTKELERMRIPDKERWEGLTKQERQGEARRE